MTAHIGSGQIFPVLGAVPPDTQIRNFGPKFWPFVLEYLENGMSQRYMSVRLELNISSTRAFQICKSQSGSHQGVHPRMAGLCLADALVFLEARTGRRCTV